MKYFIVFALLISSVSTAVCQNKRVCVMGSSTAWGYFTVDGTQLYPRDSGWAFKLKKHYKDLHVIDTLYNIAANSSSCYDGMPSSYVPPPGRNQPYPGFNITKAVRLLPKPDVIIVNYPTNQYDWLSKEEILFCLQTIKDSANASGIRCFITTTQPRDNFSEAERVKLKELRDLIVQRFGPYAIDFWTDVTVPVNLMNPLYNLGDKIHLTPEAHTLLKNRVVNSNIFFSALAVSQLTVHAQQHHGAILLDWSTTTEVNSHHFEVQKSADGIHFTQLSNIAAAGNSSGLRRYSFEDTHPNGGCSYYRVMAVDNTGQKDFSNKISIVFKPAAFNVGEVYANPVRNQINIRLASDRREQLSILVLDATGKQLLSEKVILTSSMVYNKDVSRFSAGTYRIVVDNGSTSISRSFTKQ